MLGGKAFSLVQRLARDGGDVGTAAALHEIPRQIVDAVGRGPFQRGADLVRGGAGGVEREITDLDPAAVAERLAYHPPSTRLRMWIAPDAAMW